MLLGALALSALGFAWLALAMDVHWQQVVGPVARNARSVTAVRAGGVTALAASLALTLLADNASMAALVWIMALAAGALLVAFTLSWRARVLRWLVPAGWRSPSTGSRVPEVHG